MEENKKLKKENSSLLLTIQNLQEANTTIINKDNNNDARKIIELYEKLENKEKENKELKNKIESNSNNINNLMTVIFRSIDLDIHYSLICKETDTFSTVENKLILLFF